MLGMVDAGTENKAQKSIEESIQNAKIAARVAAENKGQDIVLMDLSRQTSISIVS